MREEESIYRDQNESLKKIIKLNSNFIGFITILLSLVNSYFLSLSWYFKDLFEKRLGGIPLPGLTGSLFRNSNLLIAVNILIPFIVLFFIKKYKPIAGVLNLTILTGLVVELVLITVCIILGFFGVIDVN